MRRTLATVVATVALSVAAVGVTLAGPTEPNLNDPTILPVPTIGRTPAEDDPAFRCEDHGNRECGPHRIPVPGYPAFPGRHTVQH